MDRIETYVGQSILEWNFSKPDQNKMVALGKVISAMFGSTTVASGLACTPTTAASLFVNIAPGEIYQAAPLEATICGTLPADTAHTIMKQGIALDAVVVPNAGTGVTAFSAPVISGQSTNYLIEAAYADADVSLDPTTGNSPVVLPFYNASSPTSLYQGPNGTGVTSNTFRKGTVTLRIKAGTSATTGTQVTPSVDSGYVGLWVVTVAYGQTAINTANITAYAGAPVLPTSVLASIQSGNLQYGADVSITAGVVQGVFPMPPVSLVDNQRFWVKIKNTNTGAMTFTPNVGVISAAPVVGAAHVALQGGECVVNGRALLVWRADIASYVLESCTGAALQVAPASASQHAAQIAQLAQIQNFNATVASSALTGTYMPAGPITFRNVTVGGTPLTVVPTAALSLTVPSGATLGTIASTQARLVWLLLYNAGSPVLGVVNLAGSVNLDETGLISSTAISSSATANNVVYTTAAVTSSPYRVIGFCDITEATAGTWSTAPTLVQGAGGQALAAMASLGYGQTMQNVAASRAAGTTYYNTTGRPIQVNVSFLGSTASATIYCGVNGVYFYGSACGQPGNASGITFVVPPGGSYSANMNNGTSNIGLWAELR